MPAHIEGTLTLDGLLEGHLPADQGAEKLREWVNLLGQSGLRLNLQIDGNRFSVFAESVTIQSKSLGSDAPKALQEAMQQLVDAIGSVEEHEVFSTLRSIEYQPGTEVQTVYMVKADGTVDVEQERLVAETTPPAAPMTTQQKLKLFGGAALVILVLFGLSTLVIDYSKLWEKVVPLDASTIEIDDSRFASWFSVEGVEVAGRSQLLRLTLKRTTAYPKNLQEQRRIGNQNLEPPYSVRAHAVLAGYVRCEAFDKDGKLIGTVEVRTRGLEESEKIQVEIRVPRDPRPAKLVFVP